MKGIILAGGSGSRLYPITKSVSKQLLPIYDKPMIYYPLSVLMLAGIKDILIITSQEYLSSYKNLLEDGSQFGVNIDYATQKRPDGIAQSFIIGEEFIGNDNVCLILGDNIFYGDGLSLRLQNAALKTSGATIFSYQVSDPERFGIVEFNKNNEAILITEKPKNPKSNFAITGLYFYDNDVIKIAKSIKPSDRGELEITSVNEIYLKSKKLYVEVLGRGFAWLDTGTQQSLIDASQFVETIENRQGYKIACLEEIALNQNWITDEMLKDSVKKVNKNPYTDYLLSILDKK